MRIVMRGVSTAIATTCILALMAVNAMGARSMLVEPGGEFRAPSAGVVTFEEATLRLVKVRCLLTLSGGLTNVGISKANARLLAEGVIGLIREGGFAECTESLGGAAEMRLLVSVEAPFKLRYDAFLGTLPRITGVQLVALGFRLLVRSTSGTCLYEADLPLLVTFPSREEANSVRIAETTRLRLISGGGCPEQGTLAGTLNLRPAQALLLSEARLTAGQITARPSPFRWEGRTTKELTLTNVGQEVVIVRAILAEGGATPTREGRCGIMLPGERCLVLMSGGSTSRGEISIEYLNPRTNQEVTVPYGP